MPLCCPVRIRIRPGCIDDMDRRRWLISMQMSRRAQEFLDSKQIFGKSRMMNGELLDAGVVTE